METFSISLIYAMAPRRFYKPTSPLSRPRSWDQPRTSSRVWQRKWPKRKSTIILTLWIWAKRSPMLRGILKIQLLLWQLQIISFCSKVRNCKRSEATSLYFALLGGFFCCVLRKKKCVIFCESGIFLSRLLTSKNSVWVTQNIYYFWDLLLYLAFSCWGKRTMERGSFFSCL